MLRCIFLLHLDLLHLLLLKVSCIYNRQQLTGLLVLLPSFNSILQCIFQSKVFIHEIADNVTLYGIHKADINEIILLVCLPQELIIFSSCLHNLQLRIKLIQIALLGFCNLYVPLHELLLEFWVIPEGLLEVKLLISIRVENPFKQFEWEKVIELKESLPNMLLLFHEFYCLLYDLLLVLLILVLSKRFQVIFQEIFCQKR